MGYYRDKMDNRRRQNELSDSPDYPPYDVLLWFASNYGFESVLDLPWKRIPDEHELICTCDGEEHVLPMVICSLRVQLQSYSQDYRIAKQFVCKAAQCPSCKSLWWAGMSK